MSKIWYISPFSQSKNIGRSINESMRIVADDDDWVVHVDQDAMFLRPDSKLQLEKILESTKFDILGPVTNRLSMPHQVIDSMFDITDISEHIKVANYRHEHNYGEVTPTTDILAAFCLCFRMSAWVEIGGFIENSIQFDTVFCCDALNLGYTLGIMQGIYVYHLYRSWSDNPKYDIAHLI